MKKIPRSKIKDHIWLKMYRTDALTKQLSRCEYCTQPMMLCNTTADHVIPVSSGGTTTRDNIVAACKECNSAKGKISKKEFTRLIKSSAVPDTKNVKIIMVWFNRRLWIRTHKVVENIKKMVEM